MRARLPATVAAALLVAAAAPAYAQVFELAAANPKAPVTRFVIAESSGWNYLEAQGPQGEFRIWVKGTSRYIVQEGNAEPREYRHAATGEAVLPATLPWEQLWPKLSPDKSSAHYLGHTYRAIAATAEKEQVAEPPASPRVIALRPDLLVGQPHNTKQKDPRRRYDQSDYEYILLTRDDYRAMAEAGINVVNVNAEQLAWAHDLGLYYWGPVGGAAGGAGLPFPAALYRSQYLGPAIFLDEPAVGTRDHILRPRLAKDAAFRRAITPQIAFDEFRRHFAHVLTDGAPTAWHRALAKRRDLDLGSLQLVQHNLYTWETMPDTAAWQLSQDRRAPAAFVFEPPGRIGSRRTIPEIDMTYGVTLPPGDPRALTAILYGFLRGAARATGKTWGVSIYGQVDRADAPFWLTHAYDLGATHFFFWSSYQLACVPFDEVLALARHLTAHARQQPPRELDRLRRTADTAILLPPGYGLGHVQTGKGSLWGINELNLERVNRRGVKHRAVMSAFFRAIEAAWRAGEPFDLLWDLPGLRLDGYRRIVRISENSQEPPAPLARNHHHPLAPRLAVTIERDGPVVKARAVVVEETTGAPVWYTLGADTAGVHRNAAVAWELFGPNEEDYLFLMPDKLEPDTRRTATGWESTTTFRLTSGGGGVYRLRAATVDTAGRSTVVWTNLR